MERLRRRWAGWKANPDWTITDRLESAALIWLGGTVAGFLATVYAVVELSVPLPVSLLTSSIGAVALVLTWVFRRRVKPAGTRVAVSFPPPPSRKWRRLEKGRGFLRASGLLALALMLWLGGVFLVLAVAVALSADEGSVTTGAGAVAFFATLMMILLASGAFVPAFYRAGKQEFREALNALVSPAMRRAAALRERVDELAPAIAEIDALSREVITLQRDLIKEIETRQAEFTSEIQRANNREIAGGIPPDQVDALLEEWDERHRKERGREKRRDVGLCLAGIVAGFALSVLWQLFGPAA